MSFRTIVWWVSDNLWKYTISFPLVSSSLTTHMPCTQIVCSLDFITVTHPVETGNVIFLVAEWHFAKWPEGFSLDQLLKVLSANTCINILQMNISLDIEMWTWCTFSLNTLILQRRLYVHEQENHNCPGNEIKYFNNYKIIHQCFQIQQNKMLTLASKAVLYCQ